MQNGSRIFWVSSHSFDSPFDSFDSPCPVVLVFICAFLCSPSHCVPLQQPSLWVLPLFSSVVASLTPSLLSVVLAVVQQYYSISCLGLIRNLNITTLICCCSEDPLLSATKDVQFLIKNCF